MVFFNYATMQMAAKIVYYGPGLCGKTTNLHHIYAKTSPQSRGEMVSLETESDRTLFFDLLPLDVGVIAGFKTRLQLYTVPGQVFYNTTRKLVLKGVDGIVFVADSQEAMQDANADSFNNLKQNLAELGLTVEGVPLVIQLNKRDLPNALPVDAILDGLDPDRKHTHIEAIAATGVGVFETLKLISKLTLRTLRRMTGDEAAQTGARGQIGTVRVVGAPTGPVAVKPVTGAQAAVAAPSRATAPQKAFTDPALAKSANIDARILSDAPIAARDRVTEPLSPAPAVHPPAATTEPDINFGETEKAARTADVKHVKVRSSIDVMAELEALRKRATAGTAPKTKKEPAPPGRDVQKSVSVSVPGVLPKTRSVRVTVSFENSDDVLETVERSVDMSDASDAQSLTVNLRIDS